ncbi:hypothetical protein [Psychrilyobacter sp.]|uniref:hypothetical protein n=1 Tax=Psychrilyobacter sp. TaxID=2586924 RepID=UPI00301B46D8
MIIIVRKFRNKIAHNQKFVGELIEKAQINRKDAISHLKYNLYKPEDLQEQFGFDRKDVYSMIVSLINLLGDDFSAPQLIRELLSIFEGGHQKESIKLYFEHNGFPIDVLDRLEILIPNEQA